MAASKPISLSTNIETFLFSLNNNFWFVLITIQKSSSLLYSLAPGRGLSSPWGKAPPPPLPPPSGGGGGD